MPLPEIGLISLGMINREIGRIDNAGNLDTSNCEDLSDCQLYMDYLPNNDPNWNHPSTQISEYWGGSRALVNAYYFVSQQNNGQSPELGTADICSLAFNSSPLTPFKLGVGSFKGKFSEMRPQLSWTDQVPNDGDYVYVYIGSADSVNSGVGGRWNEYIWDDQEQLLICTNNYINADCLTLPNGGTGGGEPSGTPTPAHTLQLLVGIPQSITSLCTQSYRTVWSDASTLAASTILYDRTGTAGNYSYPLLFNSWVSENGFTADKWNGSTFTSRNTAYSCS